MHLTFAIFVCLSITVAGQLSGLSSLPSLPVLPSPKQFLERLLNATLFKLLEIIADFTFNEIRPDHVEFLFYNENESVTVSDTFFYEYGINRCRTEPIKFIIHGWKDTGDTEFVQNMAKSYQEIKILNVFGVDWSTHAMNSYLHSAKSSKKVGEIVGNFIINLIGNDTKLLPNVHLIGHSVGAHVCGFAGRHIQTLTNGKKIGRITGLDAAAPLFEFPLKLPNDFRLSDDDADFVDGIHTNAGFYGFLTSYGHNDFYISLGGPIQPGCEQINILKALRCSHIKAHEIYTITITSKKYVSTRCGNVFRAVLNMCDEDRKVIMGEHTSTKANGKYFIDIGSDNEQSKRRSIKNKILKLIPGFN